MLITIKNCNNIDEAKISLEEEKLNIKIAPNGTGKSTIANALRFYIENDESSLNNLKPFKFKALNPSKKGPEIIIEGKIQNVMCFNEVYVNKFIFQNDELLANSFDILIRTEDYKKTEKDIEDLVGEIKQLFTDNQKLETLIINLRKMSEAFKSTKSGIAKSSIGMKGLSGGNKIHNIPLELNAYKPFIQSQKSVEWVAWQTTGYDYSEFSDSCPFCTSDTADKMDLIKKVGFEYDKNTIKNLVNIINIIAELGIFFSEEAKSKLLVITTLEIGIEKEHEDTLLNIKNQIDAFIIKLEKIKTLSGFQFKDGDKVAEVLASYKIDFTFFSELNSLNTQEAVNPINRSIDTIIGKAGLLQGKVNQQRLKMKQVIEEYQQDINSFLIYAGYKYTVEISGEGEQARLRLFHNDHAQHIIGGHQHLSFGEKNAFAIVLFMYECLSKNPDLIILDDPVSSFDKNKKYAIMDKLFRQRPEKCLKMKTVLMLTHDLEPILDTIKSLPHFKNFTAASFLKLTNNQINERKIEKNDILTYHQIYTKILESEKNDIIKLIYMRRYFEITDDKGNAYQVLSNIFKRRKYATDSRKGKKDLSGEYPAMDSKDFEEGHTIIITKLNKENLSYDDILDSLNDKKAMKMLYEQSKNGYEKLQIFRILSDKTIENSSVIRKFINETYHIENEFICQLDPISFDPIPEYVVTECDRFLQNEFFEE